MKPIVATLMFASILLAQQPARYTISGAVIRAGSEVPIEGAQVTLTGGSSQSSITPLLTDVNGKFSFRNLGEGTYRLTFAANGYVKQPFGQRAIQFSGTEIVLDELHKSFDLKMTLTPAGTISGKVRSIEGEPLGGIPVLLLRSAYSSVNGKKFLSIVGNASTNDHGEYRIYWVNSGSYFISAGGPISGPGSVSMGRPEELLTNSNTSPETFTRTYYPGVTDALSAIVVSVAPGSEVSADFTLSRQRLFHVRGRVIDKETGKPPGSASIRISGQSPFNGGVGFGIYNSESGAFDFSEVPPGSYAVTAQYSVPKSGATLVLGVAGGSSSCGGAPFVIVSASAVIDVFNSEVENVTLTIDQGADIVGRLRTDSPSLPIRPQSRVALQYLGSESSHASYTSDCTNLDGSFVVRNITSGEYRVSPDPPPRGRYYLKDVRFGAADALNSPLKFSGVSTETIDILFGSKPAEISGIITNDKMQPMATVQVVLVPDKLRERFDLYQRATTDRNGHFAFYNLSPGDYKVFSWEVIEPYSWFDVDVIKAYETLGKVVHVEESGRATLDLKVIPVEAK